MPLILLLVLAIVTYGCAGQGSTGETSASPEATAAVIARDLQFDPPVLTLPAGVPLGISLDNRDPGILHNITLRSPDGSVAFRGETFAGIARRSYRVAPLQPGEFQLLCDVHPTMTGRLVVGGG